METAVITEQGRFDIITKALEELRLERSQLLKGKSADEAEAAVVRREKELNATLEKAGKMWRWHRTDLPAYKERRSNFL